MPDLADEANASQAPDELHLPAVAVAEWSRVCAIAAPSDPARVLLHRLYDLAPLFCDEFSAIARPCVATLGGDVYPGLGVGALFHGRLAIACVLIGPDRGRLQALQGRFPVVRVGRVAALRDPDRCARVILRRLKAEAFRGVK